MPDGTASKAASVAHLRTLALLVAEDATSAIDVISHHANGGFQIFDPSRPTRYTFSLEGVPYATTLTPGDDEDFGFRISARLGTIPFTVESPERRVQVMRLLGLCRELPGTRFVTGLQQALWIMSFPKTIQHPTPETVLYETLEFLRQIRPYVRLVRPYLETPSSLV